MLQHTALTSMQGCVCASVTQVALLPRALLLSNELFQKNVRNPNHHYFSKKYRKTPPFCIAIHLPFVPQHFWCPYALRKVEYCQYSSHLYRSTPPICIAIRLPFVSQYFWENLGGCGHWNVPHCWGLQSSILINASVESGCMCCA